MDKDINKYFIMLLEQYKVEVLVVALELKLFMYLENENMNFEKLISITNTDKQNTQVLLDALVMLELIKEEDSFYKNEQLTKKHFVYGSVSYCGDLFLHRNELAKKTKDTISTFIKNGNKNNEVSAKGSNQWAKASRTALKQEQKNLISNTIKKQIKKINEFPSMNKMLDLGCSSGMIGLEVVKENPNLEGVLFDFPTLEEVVKNHIKEEDLQNRVKFVGGDIEKDDIGSGYDLILCSNIFYFFNNKDELLEKIYFALNPKGILLSVHVEIEQEKQYENSFFYFLGLTLQGRNIFKHMQLTESFEKIGFRSINSYSSEEFPFSKTQIHIVRK